MRLNDNKLMIAHTQPRKLVLVETNYYDLMSMNKVLKKFYMGCKFHECQGF